MSNIGIYEIVNKLNGKRYIGSTAKGFNKRWNTHKSDLNRSKHHSNYLQNSWNKYGKKNFEFKILEIVEDVNLILEREQYWIDFYNSSNAEFGYNECPVAGNCLGLKHTDETKLKMSLAAIGKPKTPFSEEHKQKLAQINLGRKHSKETREKMSNSAKGKTRTKEHQDKLTESCRGRVISEETRKKISVNNIGKKLSEEAKQKISIANKGKPKPPRTKEHSEKIANKLRGKKQLPEIIEKRASKIRGRKRGEEHNRKLKEALTGQKRTEEQRNNFTKFTYKIFSPEGKEYIVNNLKKFGEEYKLYSSCLGYVANGKREHYKGWKVIKLGASSDIDKFKTIL